MIEIELVDPALNLSVQQPSDIHLSAVGDYVRGYAAIADAIHAHRSLRVLVTDRQVGKWLRVMTGKYAADRIRIVEITKRTLLAQQLGTDLPDTLSDKMIEDSRLLDLNIPARSGVSFEDHILEVFFGPFLTQPAGLRRISEFPALYDAQQWRDALNRPYVRQLFDARVRSLRQTLQKERKPGELQILEWLEKSPDQLGRHLADLNILRTYPIAVGKRVIGDAFTALLGLNLDFSRLPSTLRYDDKLIEEIQLHLAAEAVHPDEDLLERLLEQMSGCLEIELQVIRELLASGKTSITETLVERVQRKFRSLANQLPEVAEALADFDQLIPRPAPSEPDENWSAREWIAWATNEYLPYRFWLENTGRLDDTIGNIAGKYADWLDGAYGEMLYHSEYMAWRGVHNLKQKVKTHAGPVLLLMIDNLNAKFYADLRMQLQQQGYYETSLSFLFAMLPTCTEVSKKCIVTGNYSPFKGSGYKTEVERIWKVATGRSTLYVANIGELRALSQRKHDIYVLNYLPIDIALHQNENETGVSHTQSIRMSLRRLAQDIQAFARRIDAERDLMAIVASDHGSTRIPKGTINVLGGDNAKFYRKKAADEHHRYLAISNTKLDDLTDNTKFDCYIIDGKVYELPKNYLVARRLYRFLPTEDSIYVHGGFTPEETLVPLAVYHPTAIAPKPLSLALVGDRRIYIGAKADLQLEITNLNNYACNDILIELVDPNLETKTLQVPSIQQLKRIELPLSVRALRNASASAKHLLMRISYRFLDQPHQQESAVPAEFVSIATSRVDLDNL